MSNNTFLPVLVLATSLLSISCQKQIDKQDVAKPISSSLYQSNLMNGVIPFQFETINEHNFYSQGWREQQVNLVSGATVFSETSDHVTIVRGPDNNTDPRLIPGCVTMHLPTTADATLRRIRLRRGGYSGTLLADLTELKYSTYVQHNAPTIMVLQIDVTNDEVKDFNIFFEPRPSMQQSGFPDVVLNTWQQWNALDGIWHFEAVTISGLPDKCTIAELLTLHPNARIIDTPPQGHNGEGVRFTVGGTPRAAYDDTIGYFDALIIGTKNNNQSTLYDFVSKQ